MDLRPKTEPGCPPGFSSSGHHRNLENMSISELVSLLRVAYQMEDFDRVEEVLVARDARLKGEIKSLQQKTEIESLKKIAAEEELKKREEQCEKGKRAQESYQALLKKVKENGLHEKSIVEELRKKNTEFELENLKLKELKKKWLDDSNVVAELRIRVGDLEKEKLELEAEKKKWMQDKNALATLRTKCSELEETVKKNLTTIDELKAENHKLAGEKSNAEAKFVELRGRVVKLEDDTKLLMSADSSIGRNGPKADPVGQDGNELKNEMDVGGSAPFQRSKDTRHSVAPSGGKLGSENVIEILDSDDDGYISRRIRQGHKMEMLKRRISFSDDDHTSSSSSSDSSNLDNLPLHFHGITSSNKKSNSEAARVH